MRTHCFNYRPSGFRLKPSAVMMSGLLWATAGLHPAHARETDDGPDATHRQMLEEIIVTGTHIRGIQPTSSQLIGIDAESDASSSSLDIKAAKRRHGGPASSFAESELRHWATQSVT